MKRDFLLTTKDSPFSCWHQPLWGKCPVFLAFTSFLLLVSWVASGPGRRLIYSHGGEGGEGDLGWACYLAAFCCRMTGPFPGDLGLVDPEKWLLHLVFWGLCLIPPMVPAIGLWRWRPCTPWLSCSNSRPLHNHWPLSTMVSSRWSIWKLPDSMCTKRRPWEVRSFTLKAPKQHPQPRWPAWQWYHIAEVSIYVQASRRRGVGIDTLLVRSQESREWVPLLWGAPSVGGTGGQAHT